MAGPYSGYNREVRHVRLSSGFQVPWTVLASGKVNCHCSLLKACFELLAFLEELRFGDNRPFSIYQ